MKTNRTNNGSSGFTLVEIMIVVAIIGLLAAIAIPNFVKARARDNDDNNNTDIPPAVVGEVIQLSRDRSMGFLLANLDAVVAAGSAGLRLRTTTATPGDGGGDDEADHDHSSFESVQILKPSWFTI